MAALITIQFCTPAGYQPGDYAYLYGNGGMEKLIGIPQSITLSTICSREAPVFMDSDTHPLGIIGSAKASVCEPLALAICLLANILSAMAPQL